MPAFPSSLSRSAKPHLATFATATLLTPWAPRTIMLQLILAHVELSKLPASPGVCRAERRTRHNCKACALMGTCGLCRSCGSSIQDGRQCVRAAELAGQGMRCACFGKPHSGLSEAFVSCLATCTCPACELGLGSNQKPRRDVDHLIPGLRCTRTPKET